MSSSEVKNKIVGSKNYGKINASLLPIDDSVVLEDGTLYTGKIDIPLKEFPGVTELQPVKEGNENPFDFPALPFSNFTDAPGTVQNNVQVILGSIGKKGVKKYLFDLHIEGSCNLIETTGNLNIDAGILARPRRMDFFIDVTKNGTNENATISKTIFIPFQQKALSNALNPPNLPCVPCGFAFDCQIEWTATTTVNDGDQFVCRLYYKVPSNPGPGGGIPVDYFGAGNADIGLASTGVVVHNGSATNTQSGSGATYEYPPTAVPWSVQGSAKIIEKV